MEKKLVDLTVKEFIELTASDAPAPGGGSVSALSGAIAAALSGMVARLTIGKKKYADVQEDMQAAIDKSNELVSRFVSLIDEDTEAFNKVMDAFKMPKQTDEEKQARKAAREEAKIGAAQVPLNVMQACADSLNVIMEVASKGNKNSASDAAVAALQIQAACEGAALNVFINTGSLSNTEKANELNEKANSLLEYVRQEAQKALDAAKERI